MSNCQIRFQYNQVDIVIYCQRKELMRDIIAHYGIKSGLSIEEFYFLYEGNKISLDLTLAQINNKDKEILVLVYPKGHRRNEDINKKPNYIKCVQCEIPAILEFSNDYGIILLDGKNETKKIKLQQYNSTQTVDQEKIKCSKCSNTRADTYHGKFYYCFECNKNFCPICQSLHKEHKNIVDYSLKYFKCPLHRDQNFFSYCFNCKKNLCFFCVNQHKDHKIIILNDLYQEQNTEINEKIQKTKESVDDIIDSLKKFKDNLDIYVQINEKLNENLLNINVNYEILKSINNLNETSFLKKDLERILNCKDDNEKFQKIMSMYETMEGKNEITQEIKIEQNEVNKTIYFLDNTQETDGNYIENGKEVKHNHDNLIEMNESNTTLIIDGKKVPFKKYFIPTKIGTFLIKLLFKNNLSNCAYMFCNCKNIINIDFSKFNTKNLTNMQNMFEGCSGLESLDLKSFNSENVFNMGYMFSKCSSLTTLNLSSFNTQNVTSMRSMFNECSSLKKIDLSLFDVQKVTNMRCMFRNCSSLTEVNFSSFNTQNVTDMEGMFQVCSSLKALNISSFNTQKVTNMHFMFGGCSSLTSLNLSSFNTQNVTDMKGMFTSCFSLTSLYLSSFNTQNVTNMSYMFGPGEQNINGCFSLTMLDLSSFNTENVKNMEGMFWNCSSLTEINLSSFITLNVNNMRCMFLGCSSLTILNLSSFNTKNVTNMVDMFNKCCSLTILNLSSFNAAEADTKSMFAGCKKLLKCESLDKKIVCAFNRK